jgi:hypothetical protein
MFIFGYPERFGRENGNDDRSRKSSARFEGGSRRLCLRSLFVAVYEDRRAVLAASIRELAICVRRIHRAPERVEECIVSDNIGPIVHEHGFGVAGSTRRDIAVGGLGLWPTRVPAERFSNAGHGFERTFETPKAAACEGGYRFAGEGVGSEPCGGSRLSGRRGEARPQEEGAEEGEGSVHGGDVERGKGGRA